MLDLNDLDAIRELDPADVYGSTGMFAAQCQQMVDEHWGKIQPAGVVDNLVICGMGGSAYGAHVAAALYPDALIVPLTSVSDYHLPAFVGPRSLVLLTSYSGTTEEVLACAQEARQRGAQTAVLTGGGALAKLVQDGTPGIVFDARQNPSNQPRLGTGYIITGTIILLSGLGVLPVSRADIQAAVDEARGGRERVKQSALDIAPKLCDYIPVTLAAQHLVGNAHILRNQFNETSKSFSAYEDIPELNHHLMEGLKNPADKKLKALFLASSLYEAKHSRRLELTEEVISKNGVESLRYDAAGSTKLAQVLDALAFGGYLSLYLGFLYGQDPSVVPWVDYFKDRLG